MRTTIEITEAQRAKLLEIASGRGEKGFSSVVRDAVDAYLKAHESREDAIRAALGVRGALAGEEGEALAQETASLRRHWR